MLNFLRTLPREIRDQIYKDVLRSETGIVIFLPSPLSPRARVLTSTTSINSTPSYSSNTNTNPVSSRSSTTTTQETVKDTSSFTLGSATSTPQTATTQEPMAAPTPSTTNMLLSTMLPPTATSYKYIIQQFTPWAEHEYTLSHSQRITLNITQTCRQLYHETRGMFWKLNQVWGADVRTWRLVQEIRGASEIRWSDLVKREKGRKKIEVGKRDGIVSRSS